MYHGFPPEIYPHYTVFSMSSNSVLFESSKGTGLIEETTKDKRRLDDQRLSKVLSANPHSDWERTPSKEKDFDIVVLAKLKVKFIFFLR